MGLSTGKGNYQFKFPPLDGPSDLLLASAGLLQSINRDFAGLDTLLAKLVVWANARGGFD